MFRIGEFSKIGQVSGRQLRHYDKLGLLRPAHTDPSTGYRYYTAHQLPRLNRILALKELGLSMAQIARLVNEDISSEEIRGMLLMKQAQVEQTLQEEMARLQYIETRIEQIDRDGQMVDYDLVVKSVPTQRYLSLRSVFRKLLNAQLLGLEMHQLLPTRVGAGIVGNFTVIIHAETWEDEDLDMEIGVIVDDDFNGSLRLSDGSELTVRDLPGAETMLTVARLGRPSLGHGSYSVLGVWLDANGYRFDGPGREVYFTFPFPGRESETVTEIQFPVAKIDRGRPRLS